MLAEPARGIVVRFEPDGALALGQLLDAASRQVALAAHRRQGSQRVGAYAIFTTAHYIWPIGTRLARVITAATLALVGLGCAGSDDDQGASVPSPTTTEPTTTEETFEGGTATVTGEAQISETALLERVAVAGHDGYDRVVFQFRNGIPGYRVEYVEPPLREDGSGNVVQLDGEAFVVVRMEPASGFDLSVPEGELIYTGPRRIAGSGTSAVREIVRTGDFEAVLAWAVGLDEHVPFRVLTLENPARIVVDFAAP